MKYTNLIKQIFHAEWKYGHIILYFTVTLCASLVAYYNFSKGFVVSSDSRLFSSWADDLIRLDFNLYLYYSQNTFINPNYIYSIPIILIALSNFKFCLSNIIVSRSILVIKPFIIARVIIASIEKGIFVS